MAKKKQIQKNINEENQNYKDSSSFDNPFKNIDKSSFRSDNRKEPKNAVKKPVYQEKIVAPHTSDAFENDEDYFLFAMSNVNSVKNKEKYKQKEENAFKVEKEQKNDKKTEDKTKKDAQNPLFSAELTKKLQKTKEEKNNLAHTLQNSLSQNMQSTSLANKNQNKQNNLAKTQNKLDINSQTIPEDNEYFDFFSAVQDVKPLDGKERLAPPEPEKIIVQQDQTPLLHDFEEGKLEFSLSANEEHVQCNILGLDLLTLGKLQNRHYNPEASIDLHGFNAKEAFEALIPFFKNAYYKDMRCVLIVTGKGLNSYDKKSILRAKVCDWLIDMPFKYITLAFCTAKTEDGGAGALYVLLRKRRKNSPEIAWHRIPNDYDIWADLDK